MRIDIWIVVQKEHECNTIFHIGKSKVPSSFQIYGISVSLQSFLGFDKKP